MISVEDALHRILDGAQPLEAEDVALEDAPARILARDITALRTHPPHDQSAMDGYAARAEDVKNAPVRLEVIGESPAGRLFEGEVKSGQAVRIFTGGAIPAGADCIVIQENVEKLDGSQIEVQVPGKARAHIRAKGLDINTGDVALRAGQELSARHIGLAASAGHATLPVHRAPRVALLFTGSELVEPGAPCGPDKIVNSNAPMLAALVRAHGGVPISLGIAADDAQALLEKAEGFAAADICVTVGGASVGDHDLVQPVLKGAGLHVDFWKIAMRPGKPLIFGDYKGRPFLGLPGNPVSAMVCATLYLLPLIRKMAGETTAAHPLIHAEISTPLPGNGSRQDYMRATLERSENGTLIATPLPVQDSSMLSTLARADALIVRPPNAPAVLPGERVSILRL